MSFRKPRITLALLPLAAVLASAEAQDGSRGNHLQPAPGVLVEKDLTLELETAPQEPACEATITLQYSQRNTIARVDRTIETATCAAAAGDYTLAINVRDANGELKTLEFHETWQRSDGRPVESTSDYPIGENVDLASVRSRRLRCACAAAPVPASPAAGSDDAAL